MEEKTFSVLLPTPAGLRENGYAGDLTTEVTCFDGTGAVDLPRLAKTLHAMRDGMMGR